MRILQSWSLVMVACSSSPPATPREPVTPTVQRTSCPTEPTVPAHGWTLDTACQRLLACADRCPAASCLLEHYGCRDSGTVAALRQDAQGAAYWITVPCCPD